MNTAPTRTNGKEATVNIQSASHANVVPMKHSHSVATLEGTLTAARRACQPALVCQRGAFLRELQAVDDGAAS